MKKIAVIIPAFGGFDKLPEALGSVMMQDIRNDIEVIIVDDCTPDGDRYDTIKTALNDILYIRVIHKGENAGCGQARQTGVNHCEAEYFTFLDVDDCFASPFSLSMLYAEAKRTGADIVGSKFCEELDPKVRGDNLYRIHAHDGTWMHGKLFRTRFIKYHNIRFSTSRSNEDSAYNTIAYALTDRVSYIDVITHIWKYNPDSLTRRSDWLRETMGEFIANSAYAITEMRKKSVPEDKLKKIVCEYFVSFYAFRQMMLCRYEEELNDKILGIMRSWCAVVSFDEWDSILTTDDYIAEAKKNTNLERAREVSPIFRETFNDFYKSMTGGKDENNNN